MTEDPYCQSNAVFENRLSFMEGEHTKYVYYYGYATFNHQVSMANGSIPGQTASISITNPTDPQLPFLTMNLPNIKSPILGSHEFPKTIVISPSAGATIECFQADQPYSYGTFTTPCPGFNSGTNIFTWTAADASQASMKGFVFVARSGSRFSEYYFVPESLYSSNNPVEAIPFDVKNCDTILNSNGTTGWNDINGNSSNVLCLGPGSFSGGTAAAKALGADRYIIGSTSVTGESNTIFNAPPSFPAISVGAVGTTPGGTVANISFVGAGTGATNPLINMTSGSLNIFRSVNNTFTTSQYHPMGILKNNLAAALNSISDRFLLDGTGVVVSGIKIGSVSSSPDDTAIFNPSFELQSGTGVNFARAVTIHQSEAVLEMHSVQVGAPFNNGSLITVEQASAESAYISVYDSDMNFNGLGNSNRFPFYLGNGEIFLDFGNVRVKSAMPQNIIKANNNTADFINIIFANTRFVVEDHTAAVFINSAAIQNLEFNNAQFVRQGAVGVGTSAFSVSVAHMADTPVLYAPQNILFCGISGAANWAAPFSTAVHGSSTMTTPAVTTNYDTSSESCY